MTSNELTISHAQKHQPWTVPYSTGVEQARADGTIPHIMSSHAVLHAAKSVGKLAAVFEKLDHQHPTIRETVDETLLIGDMCADLVTAALRLANLHGIDLAKVLVERIEEKNGINILKLGDK
jgi:hypothetical protein